MILQNYYYNLYFEKIIIITLCMKAVFIILFPFVVGVCDHFLGAAAPCAHVGTNSRGHQVLIRAAGDWTVCKHAVNISIHYQIVL